MKQQKDFWQDSLCQKTLIFITNPYSLEKIKTHKHYKLGGRVINNAEIYFINPSMNSELDFIKLIAHENLHFWFGSKLLNGSKWFTEGFTEYFSYLINLKNQMISQNEFMKKYDYALDQYSSSEYKNLDNDYVEMRFWENKKAEKFPYHKGFLLAYELDKQIKSYSKNRYELKDVLSVMIRDANRSKHKVVASKEMITLYIKKVTGLKISNDFWKKYHA